MNSREAKFILEACRRGELDPNDPKMAEARRALDAHPELAEWFAATQDLDRAVVAKLKSVPVPSDLLERICAGQPAAQPRSQLWSRRQAWWSIAAALAVLLTIGAVSFFRSGPVSLATFRNEMADFMDRRWDHTFDLSDPLFTRLQQWLESQPEPIRLDLPPGLVSSQTIGCKVFRWHGTKASLICFTPNDAGAVVHILVVDRSIVTDAPGDKPILVRLPHLNTAVWSRGDKLYLALTTAEPDKLMKCL